MARLSELSPGDKFTTGLHEYIVLDKNVYCEDPKDLLRMGVLVVESECFDSVQFGEINDWRKSPIRERLNGKYLDELIKNGVDSGAILPFKIDLKEANGGCEYGYDICRVGLLTLEQQIKYAELIPLDHEKGGWWLVTPFNTPNGRMAANGKKCDSNYAWSAWDIGIDVYGIDTLFGIRPVMVLDPYLDVTKTGEIEAV